MRVDDRIQKIGFNQGFGWLIHAARLVQTGKKTLVGVGALWLLISMVAVIPVIGQLILAVITPMLTAGVLVAFDQVAAGRQAPSSILLTAWHRPKARPKLLMLGLWTIIGAMVALSFLASWLTQQISEAELQAALAEPENFVAVMERLEAGTGMYLAIGTVGLVLMGLYFAIPLVIFGDAGLWPSIRASLKAIVINALAFIGYLLTLIVVIGAFLMVLTSLISLMTALPGVLGTMLAQITILVLSMGLQILLAGAQYVAFCQIFGWTATVPDSNNHQTDSSSDDELTL